MSAPDLPRRVLSIGALVTAATAGALGLEALLSRGSAAPFGHSQPGHGAGWLGLAVTLVGFLLVVAEDFGNIKRVKDPNSFY